MDFDFVLMRHAYSRHNHEKDQWKERFGGKSYKTLTEYRISKFTPELIDSPWINFPNELPNPIEINKLALVICSPLKRCLETCRRMMGEENNLPVIVEPLLASRLSAAWSIGSDAFQLQRQYPNYDFSAFKGLENYWMVDLLSYLPRFSLEQMQNQGLSMQEYLLQKVSTGQAESYCQFFLRTRKLKKRLLELTQEFGGFSGETRQVLIIGHSCILSFLLGEQLNEKGKVKDKISFQHCEGVKFSCERVLGCSKFDT